MNNAAAANDTTAAPVYLSTVERAALIRKALKAKGWNSRMVSVRSSVYSMGSSITVKILVPTIRKADVVEIAVAHEDVSRDESGEILSGGNRFVHVEYADEAVRPIRNKLAALLKVGNKVRVGGWTLTETSGGDPSSRWIAMHPEKVFTLRAWDADGLARQVALALLDPAGAR